MKHPQLFGFIGTNLNLQGSEKKFSYEKVELCIGIYENTNVIDVLSKLQ